MSSLQDLPRADRASVRERLARQPLCKRGHARRDDHYLGRDGSGYIIILCGPCHRERMAARRA